MPVNRNRNAGGGGGRGAGGGGADQWAGGGGRGPGFYSGGGRGAAFYAGDSGGGVFQGAQGGGGGGGGGRQGGGRQGGGRWGGGPGRGPGRGRGRSTAGSVEISEPVLTEICTFYARNRSCTSQSCRFQHDVCTILQIPAHAAPITDIAVNLPGNCLLTAGKDNAVKIWNLNPLGNLQLTVPTPGPVTRIAMDNTNGPVFMWAVEELLRPPDVNVGCIYHLDSGTMQTSRVACLARFPGDAAFTHPRPMMSLVILMQGVGGQPTLFTGGGEGDIAVWVHEGGSFVRKNRLEGHLREVSSMVIVGGCLWSASYDHTVRIWDLNTMQPLRVISTDTCPGELSDGRPIAHYDRVTSLAVITQPSVPDPGNPSAPAMITSVASGSMDGTVKLMTDSGEIQGSWDHGETGKVCSLEFMSNIAGNRCLLIGLENGNIIVRTTATFNILFMLDRQVCNTGPILSLKAVQTPTGQEGSDPTAVFASGSADGQLILWQVEKPYIADVAVVPF